MAAGTEPFTPEEVEEMTADLAAIIKELRRRLYRMPTEQEVTDFLWGDDATRQAILDKAL